MGTQKTIEHWCSTQYCSLVSSFKAKIKKYMDRHCGGPSSIIIKSVCEKQSY